MDRTEQTRRELTEYNDALRAELAKAPAWKKNTRWAIDREREIELNERRLALLEGK